MRAAVTMTVAMAMAMAATDLLQSQLRQLLSGKTLQVRSDRAGLRLVHLQSRLHESRKRPGTDPANGDGVNGMPAQCRKRPAGAVLMVQIAIDHFGDGAAVGFNDQEHRRRTEVIEDSAFQPVILCYRETDLHLDTSFYFVYMHNTMAPLASQPLSRIKNRRIAREVLTLQQKTIN